MIKSKTVGFIIMSVLFVSESAAAPGADGTKGQNFDRIVFETTSAESVDLTARVMTINRFVDSASIVSVKHNGAELFSPENITAEKWTKTISVSGSGMHEVVMVCKPINSKPVYCSLTLESPQIRTIE